MNRSATFLVTVTLLLISAHRLPAPIQEVAETPTPAAAQSAKPRPKPTIKPKAESESSRTENSNRQFAGTWIGRKSRDLSSGYHVNWIYTMVIRHSKTALKTVDVTYISPPGKPTSNGSNELRIKWMANSTACIAEGSTLSIQWSAAKLAGWAPKTIPRETVQSYGYASPDMSNAGLSAYKLQGDTLTRINDPDPVTYQRAK